jgi:hypothetical protein
LPERRERITFGSTDVHRQLPAALLRWLRSKEDQFRQLRCRQPRKPAAIVSPAQRQSPIAVEAVPAGVGGVERFAPHGLDRVSEQARDFAYLDFHV